MAGEKETYRVTLNTDHMAFIQSSQVQYDIADDDKTLRIILDYVLSNPGLHQDIFTEVRCLRCE
ncbi:MAG: hypothetical protein EXR54_01080 [Dehalococcoidia bacterium]|nr:hypothetical protein [Dehalococcoidia bacterium]MSQ16151.1 hypothetical protein [Dehalococcoidia bacterium]